MNRINEARKMNTTDMLKEMKKIKEAVKSTGVESLYTSRLKTVQTTFRRKKESPRPFNSNYEKLSVKVNNHQSSSMPKFKTAMPKNRNTILKSAMAHMVSGRMNFGKTDGLKIDISYENLKPEDKKKLYRGVDKHKQAYYEMMDDLVDDAYR